MCEDKQRDRERDVAGKEAVCVRHNLGGNDYVDAICNIRGMTSCGF